jgi:hypothetical protein
MSTFRILVCASATMVFVPPLHAALQETTQPERGEQILNAACLTCHDTRPIDIQALDEAAWTKEVKSMVEKGAKLTADDERPLVEYLVRRHGPMPDGPGKDLVLNICTQCHDLERVRRTGRTPEGWLEVLENMLNEGAPLSEKDLPDVLRYLARNFKPERR